MLFEPITAIIYVVIIAKLGGLNPGAGLLILLISLLLLRIDIFIITIFGMTMR